MQHVYQGYSYQWHSSSYQPEGTPPPSSLSLAQLFSYNIVCAFVRVVCVCLQVPNPKPWAVGAPNLHTVTVGISDANEVYDDIEVCTRRDCCMLASLFACSMYICVCRRYICACRRVHMCTPSVYIYM